jgi:hypothetical protein
MALPGRRRVPRLEKIREMRSEIRRLDAVLARTEAMFGPNGNRIVGNFEMKAIEGWVQSLIESYVVLVYTNMPKPLDRNISLQKMYDQLRQTSQKFEREAGTIWEDEPPEPYYPSIYDRFD